MIFSSNFGSKLISACNTGVVSILLSAENQSLIEIVAHSAALAHAGFLITDNDNLLQVKLLFY